MRFVRHALTGLLSSGVLFAGHCPGAMAQSAGAPAEISYDIPSLPMNIAIARFAEASDVDVLSERALAEGRHSSPLIGHFTPQVGITILLRNSGLASRFLRPKTAIIFQTGSADTQPSRGPFQKGPALDLDPVQVQASPIIGSNTPMLFYDYGRAAQSQILSWLKSDSVLGTAHFQIKIDLTLNRDGTIASSSFVEGSGVSSLDQRILTVIGQLRLKRPPPPGLPQPMRFMVYAK